MTSLKYLKENKIDLKRQVGITENDFEFSGNTK